MSASARRSRRSELRRDLAVAAIGREGGSDFARDALSERRRDPAPRPEVGTLFVVATPIGNLEDITLRALRVLREVAVIAAEDTRRTSKLLRHYGIQTRLLSLHEHNERQRVDVVVERLRAGHSVALVSDAGTPAISDPGAWLVRSVRDAGLPVEAIPGPSSITAALSVSGIEFDRFVFAGFPPNRVNDRNHWFSWVKEHADVPVVCFEAPHRIQSTLAHLSLKLGERPIYVARELTKLHEELIIWSNDRNYQAPVLNESTNFITERGEFVLILAPQVDSSGRAAPAPIDDSQIATLFGQITNGGAFPSRRESIRAVAERLGVPLKRVYDALERVKKASQT